MRSLVAAGEKDNEGASALNEVHAIAWPAIYPHLRYATADRPHIAWIADLQTVNARLNAPLGTTVAQAGKPTREDFRLANFDQHRTYPLGYKIARAKQRTRE